MSIEVKCRITGSSRSQAAAAWSNAMNPECCDPS